MKKEHGERTGFRSSPARFAIGVFIAVVASLLVFEHRVHLFGSSPLVLLLLVCVGMHFLMHRGHGGHGGGGDGGN
jgi:amino acid permease